MHNGQVHIYLIVKCNRVTKSMPGEFILRVFLTQSVDNFFTFSHSSQATLRNSIRTSLCKRKIYQIILKNAVAICYAVNLHSIYKLFSVFFAHRSGDYCFREKILQKPVSSIHLDRSRRWQLRFSG